LQGVLTRNHQGDFELRYLEDAELDEFGGRVRLEPDSRIEHFQKGCVIQVEGELIPEHQDASSVDFDRPRRYRVRQAWLIESGHTP
jgi:hypothetical protein